ncbi:MAG TPA: amidohydrolase family protein, partial [Nevskiaceae bacterium]|nr:amidohydrolase family protein [Nevskiaceae bacterium]
PLTEPGISALETLLPLALELVHDKLLTPLQLAQRLSLGPADVLGIDGGRLAAGRPANLVLVDPDRRWTLQTEEMLSAGRNTPFGGRRFRGRAVRTLAQGLGVTPR